MEGSNGQKDIVRNTLTCPTSKNGLRHMGFSESKTLMVVLQDQVPGEQLYPKRLQQTL
jgi:hypothetical protein